MGLFVPAYDHVSPFRRGRDFCCDLLVDLESGRADVWADGRDQARRLRARFNKRVHRACEHAGDTPTPAGMHSGHCARRWVGEENRHAIGDAHADRDSRTGRHQGIRVESTCAEDVVAPIHASHSAPVDLRGLEKRCRRDAQSFSYAAIVFLDVHRVVAHRAR